MINLDREPPPQSAIQSYFSLLEFVCVLKSICTYDFASSLPLGVNNCVNALVELSYEYVEETIHGVSL